MIFTLGYFIIFLSHAQNSGNANPDRVSSIVSNEINFAQCHRILRNLAGSERYQTSTENGATVYRWVDSTTGARKEVTYYSQEASQYLPASRSCRFDETLMNPTRRNTAIRRFDDNLLEIRQSSEGKHVRRVQDLRNGNYVELVSHGFNESTVTAYFKGPPEESFVLRGYDQLTPDLTQNLKNGNKSFFRNLTRPMNNRSVTPQVGQ